MSAQPRHRQSLLRFVPPLAIAVGSLTIPFLARSMKTRTLVHAASAARIAAPEVPFLPANESDGTEECDSSFESYERIEDLPLAPAATIRKLNDEELNRELIRKAEEVLWSQFPPIGTEIPLEVRGRLYIARVELHYHEVGGPKQPWGYHRGMTLYAVE